MFHCRESPQKVGFFPLFSVQWAISLPHGLSLQHSKREFEEASLRRRSRNKSEGSRLFAETWTSICIHQLRKETSPNLQTFSKEVYTQKTFVIYIVHWRKDTISSLFNYAWHQMYQWSTLTTVNMRTSLKKQSVGGLDFGPASFIHRMASNKSYNSFSLTINATWQNSQHSTEVPIQCPLLAKPPR